MARPSVRRPEPSARAVGSRLLAFLSLSLVASASAQPAISDPGAQRICAAVRDVELPPQDRPRPAEAASLAHCVSADLYFGFDRPPDPVRARQCAYVELERGGEEPALGGGAMLMMVYANGRGAARNFDAALKLACERRGAPQDVAGSIHQLDRLKKSHWTGNNFSVCNHSSGRRLYEQCAILDDRFDRVEREHTLAAIAAGWTAEDRAAFQALRQAAARFFQARAGREVDLSATLHVHELAFLERGLIAALERLERGELPAFAGGDFLEAEAAMKAAYARTQAATGRDRGPATPEGVAETQQAWRSYREAWVTFGTRKYPSVSGESWKTWLTRERTEMLERVLQ